MLAIVGASLTAKFRNSAPALLAIGLALIANPAQASGDSALYLDPTTETVAVGQDLSVTIKLDAGTKPVSGIQFRLSYPTKQFDSWVIRCAEQFSFGGAGARETWKDNVFGACGSVGTKGVTGKGLTVATVTFHAKSPGSGNVDFVTSGHPQLDTIVTDTTPSDITGTVKGAAYSVGALGNETATHPKDATNQNRLLFIGLMIAVVAGLVEAAVIYRRRRKLPPPN